MGAASGYRSPQRRPALREQEAGAPNGWLVEPDDQPSLTEALVEAVNDDDVRRERGENAYRQIRAKYSWRSLAERFAGVYETMLRGRSS